MQMVLATWRFTVAGDRHAYDSMIAVEHAEHLAALAVDGAAFSNACAAAGLDAKVPACPGWSVADLLWHMTEVHHFCRTIVGEQRTTPTGYEQPARPSNEDLLALYAAGLRDTLEVLRAADPQRSNWTWTTDHTAGFFIRRMAHETAMHRWDAESAAGSPSPIEANLASDGIDEFLTHMLGDVVADAQPLGGSVHLHCTDVAGEWMVRPTEAGGLNVIREHAKGDAAIRATASDLLLALSRRIELGRVEVLGDNEVAARFVADTSLD